MTMDEEIKNELDCKCDKEVYHRIISLDGSMKGDSESDEEKES